MFIYDSYINRCVSYMFVPYGTVGVIAFRVTGGRTNGIIVMHSPRKPRVSIVTKSSMQLTRQLRVCLSRIWQSRDDDARRALLCHVLNAWSPVRHTRRRLQLGCSGCAASRR